MVSAHEQANTTWRSCREQKRDDANEEIDTKKWDGPNTPKNFDEDDLKEMICTRTRTPLDLFQKGAKSRG